MIPQKELHAAIIEALQAADYSVSGFDTFPRVEVSEFSTTRGTDKDNRSFSVSFTCDVITMSGDPAQSLEIADEVQEMLPEIDVESWVIDSIFAESIVSLHERDDRGEIYRQVILVRAEVTQKETT